MSDVDRLLTRILVLRAQIGDVEAFEDLLRRHELRLRCFVIRLSDGLEAVEDILQDIWLDAYRQLPRLKSPEAFRSWLYRIARGHIVNRLRRPRFQLIDEGEHPPADGEGADSLGDVEDLALLHRALERLPLAQREVLLLRFLEDMDYAEIAQTVGVPVGTVRSRIHYAKQALRSAMEELGHEQ